MSLFNRFKKAFIIAFILTICTAGVVYAAWEYKYPTIITDNSSVTRTYVPVVLGWKGQTFVDAGKINSSANNTNMQIGGTSLKYMIATDNVACVIPSLGGNGQQTVDFYTGYSPIQTSFPIVLGNDGYVSIKDNVGIELGLNSTSIFNGYLDTTAAASRYDVKKLGAFIAGISTTTAGTVEASVYNVWPIIAASGTSSSASGTSHAVSVGSPTVGELSVIFANYYSLVNSPTITWASDYIEIFQKTSNDGAGHYQTSGAAYKVATGSEGASVTVTTSVASTGTYGYYRITAGTYSTYITSGTAATGNSVNPNPPSCTSTYVNANCLYIAVSASTYNGVTTHSVLSYPTNYTIGQITGQVAGSGAIGIASYYLNTSSADPGTFALSGSNPWIAQTICIYPGKATASATGITSGEMKRTYTISPATTDVSETFEWGADGNSLATSGGSVTWTVSVAGTSKAEIDTAQYYSGSRSARFYRDGSNNPTAYFSQFVLSSSQYVSFYIRKDTNSYYQIAHGNGSYRAVVRITDGEVVCYSASAVSTGILIAADTWYKLALSNFNWTSHTFDIYMNDSLIYTNATMDASASSSGQVVINNLAGTSELWVDDIMTGTNPSVNIYIDDVLKDTEYLTSGVPDNTQNYQMLTDAPYTDNVTLSVNGTQQLYYSPSEMIKGKTYSTGNVSLTNGDATVTGTGTTWVSSMAGGIFYSTGGATDNVTYEISSITDTTHLELTTVYGGTTNSSQTYAMYARIPDEEATGGDNSGAVVWGSNSNVVISYGEMVSYASTSASTNETLIGFNSPDSPLPSTWFASGENIENLPFYDSFIGVSASTGQPIQTIYFIAIIGFAFGAFLLLTMFTRSALLGAIGFNVVLFIGSSMTIIPMWIPFATLIVMLGIMYLYRQVAY